MTDIALGLKGRGDQIDDFDLPRIGDTVGVGEDVVHALIEVESSGDGFDSHGRPKMLFEPHVLYRNLSGEQRAEAVRQGLAYSKWRRDYPRDSYPRLMAAIAINEEAAYRSASWGLGQILGENHGKAGYATAKEMAQAFADDEAAQLEGMVRFIRASGIADDLRRIQAKATRGETVTSSDWVTVARVYNGSNFAENHYHVRLANAFNKWLRIKDTPWSRANIKDVAKAESAHAEAAHNSGVEITEAHPAHIALAPESAQAGEAKDGDTRTIPAVPPFPVSVPDWAKKIVAWGAGLNVGGLGVSFTFLRDNPEALHAVLNIMRWGLIALGSAALLVVLGVFINKMWNAKLANDLNIARLSNFANQHTDNVDFSGWKTAPEKNEVKF